MSDHIVGERGPEVLVRGRRRYGTFKLAFGASLQLLSAALFEVQASLGGNAKILDLRTTRTEKEWVLEVQVETD